jgi:HEAT repeat-containing protein 5
MLSQTQYYTSSWSVILQAVAAAMSSNDPTIAAAMDGRESMNGASATPNAQREEPAPYFYVLFGIAFEALASSSSEVATGSGTRQSPVITALQALKCLVRPEYAGKAILEPTILDEFTGLAYRLAMTEGAAVQIHLLEMLAIFAATQDRTSGSETKCVPSENFGQVRLIMSLCSVDILSPASPRAHCLRICAHVLRHSISSAGGPVIRKCIKERQGYTG